MFFSSADHTVDVCGVLPSRGGTIVLGDMVKESLMNSTFFNFLFGFILILSISLSVILAVNYYDVTTTDVIQAAATLFFFQ